jgi:hypothetical protein
MWVLIYLKVRLQNVWRVAAEWCNDFSVITTNWSKLILNNEAVKTAGMGTQTNFL